MRGVMFKNPSSSVLAEWRASGRARNIHGPEGKFGWAWVQGAGGLVYRWGIVAYDGKGRYAIQTGREDFVEGCRPAIFVIDNPSFPYLDGERQATLLSKGVPGDIFYMPTKTKFRNRVATRLHR